MIYSVIINFTFPSTFQWLLESISFIIQKRSNFTSVSTLNMQDQTYFGEISIFIQDLGLQNTMRHVSLIANTHEFVLRLSLKIIWKTGWQQGRKSSMAQGLRRQFLVSELSLDLISIIYNVTWGKLINFTKFVLYHVHRGKIASTLQGLLPLCGLESSRGHSHEDKYLQYYVMSATLEIIMRYHGPREESKDTGRIHPLILLLQSLYCLQLDMFLGPQHTR